MLTLSSPFSISVLFYFLVIFMKDLPLFPVDDLHFDIQSSLGEAGVQVQVVEYKREELERVLLQIHEDLVTLDTLLLVCDVTCVLDLLNTVSTDTTRKKVHLIMK